MTDRSLRFGVGMSPSVLLEILIALKAVFALDGGVRLSFGVEADAALAAAEAVGCGAAENRSAVA